MTDYAIEQVALSDIRPHPDNPFDHNEEEIARLKDVMFEHGYLVPVVINQRSGYLLGGHARVVAAQENGYGTIPAVMVDFDDDQERAALIALNGHYGHWNDKKLRIALTEIKDADYSLDFTGLPEWKIQSILSDETKKDQAVSKGFGIPDITYTLIFDNKVQHEAWQRFSSFIRQRSTDRQSFAASLDQYILEVL